ncbi:Dak phosphatase [Desulforamulus reducens MI-1]|uniref:Dak phosphatase n=1 Tax=Desulforamulus reducens (strain ATCC BAA-1160 / DSM 100696 / MI-1) TaxID=349161 RepID=A4J402_DESRM|nr:DAK2 domain-containing protein [Desulforamulus reducens]ABO49805.1 Dak phosphatase [Desulforamulus reducens MI-1]
MSLYSFDGQGLKMMILGSTNLLARHKSEIDALNVFPVPDGDTGNNMYLTLLAAAKEVQNSDTSHIGEVAEAAAQACLMGARGNSGVILSQLIRGFAKALAGKEKANALEVVQALEEGANLAYQAVMNPVEGTILTVMRRSAEAARSAVLRNYDLLRVMILTLREARVALGETPELLPVLKEAGVVDAGGRGYVIILEGILSILKRAEDISLLMDFTARQEEKFTKAVNRDFDSEIHFTYCTEFIVKGTNIPLDLIRHELSPYGDCLMVVGTEQVAKVHIHSNHPGMVLENCLNYGSIHEVAIHNMREQSKQILKESEPEKEIGIVTVGTGEGIIDIMNSLGADAVVVGGQTMNPSTEEIVRSIQGVNAKGILILPNNKNIILAAEQAAKLVSNKVVKVIPTRTIPQGLSALLAQDPTGDIEDNYQQMTAAAGSVKTGEVTKAVRETTSNGLKIQQGNLIGIAEGSIVAVGVEILQVLKDMLSIMLEEDHSLVTLYYGAEIADQAEEITEQLQKSYSDIEFELHYGGQPLYYFIFSVE